MGGGRERGGTTLGDLSGASVQLGTLSNSRAAVRDGVSWRDGWPLLVPGGPLVAGAVVGYPFSLDAAVARERLLGLIVVSLFGAGAAVLLRRVQRPRGWLIGTA